MVRPVGEEPNVELNCWHFVQQDGAGFRLVGVPAGTKRGRITSAIVDYDAAERRAVTESGRVYRLVGEPDLDVGVVRVHAHRVKWGSFAPSVALADESDVVALQAAGGDGPWQRFPLSPMMANATSARVTAARMIRMAKGCVRSSYSRRLSVTNTTIWNTR